MSDISKGTWFDVGPLGAARLVASVEASICCVYGPGTTPEAEANTKAIAAVPDLLSALLLSYEQLDIVQKRAARRKDRKTCDAVLQARAAIWGALYRATGAIDLPKPWEQSS